ncbi:MAG: metallopeptidase, partial [Clostridia bacterium]|nr:metallopeptidase [Clostridia bacterium]
SIQRDLWDLACNIAVEGVTDELELRSAQVPGMSKRVALGRLRQEVGTLTAEKIYRYYLDQALDDKKLTSLKREYGQDEHLFWYLPKLPKVVKLKFRPKSGDDEDENDGNAITIEIMVPGEGGGEDDEQQGSGEGDEQQGNGGGRSDDDTTIDYSEVAEHWKDIADRVLQDLETFSKERGDSAGNMVQNLREVTREKYDYTAFLQKFATRHEAMVINDDEFDYVYYTYGLKLYHNLPLVEPLEYKDVKRIKELVIAIDTSGSVQGEEVQNFLQKTYNILKSEQSFFNRFNLHIVQCDAKIQQDKVITCQEDFDQYLHEMKLFGFGGTDFRPVFEYVDSLIEQHEFSNLKGVIYFTDGYGVFPAQKPAYDVAFVFVKEDLDPPEVPAWAIKLVLRKEEIQ